MARSNVGAVVEAGEDQDDPQPETSKKRKLTHSGASKYQSKFKSGVKITRLERFLMISIPSFVYPARKPFAVVTKV